MFLANRTATLIVLSLGLITSLVVVTFNLNQGSPEFPVIKTKKFQTIGSNSNVSHDEKLTPAQHSINSNDKCTQCLRPKPLDGVEDLFCIKKPKYIKDLKNPCWMEEGRLQCLPYFHILGCAKCATTDLAARLSLHPDIIEPDGHYDKETLWWSWRRYGHLGYKTVPIRNFSRYIQYFEPIARTLQNGMEYGRFNNTRLITLDGSPPDLWDFRSWPLLPQNHQRKEPCVLTPHLMKHIYANPKFILIFRNPTERLFSSYLFHKMGKNSVEFHKDVKTSLNILRNCQKNHTRKQCYLSSSVYNKLPTRLHFGCYSVFLKEWLNVFPRSNFLYLKTEEYTQNVTANLRLVFKFLKLSPVSMTLLSSMQKMEKVRVTKLKVKVGHMLPKTKRLLDKFYAPCNQELADLLDDTRFLWRS